MQDNRNRIDSFDIARGLGIILVIIGHTYTPGFTKQIIYLFHMPLFLFISGCFFKCRAISDLLKRDFKRLLAPYLYTCLFIIAYKCVTGAICGMSVLPIAKNWLLASLYGLPGPDLTAIIQIDRIGAIWFFEAVFWADIELTLIEKIKNRNIGWGIIIAANILSVLLAEWIWLPCNIQTGFAACPFMALGKDLFNNNEYKTFAKKRTVLLASVIICALLIIISAKKNVAFEIAYLHYPNGLFDVLGGFLGSVLFLQFMEVFQANCWASNIFKSIGKCSSYILCVHVFDLDCFGRFIEHGAFLLCFRLVFDISIGVLIGKILHRYKFGSNR